MTFPDPEKPFFSISLNDGRVLVCLFGADDLVGHDPYPEFEVVAGIYDQDSHRFGNLRREAGFLVLRLKDAELAVPVESVIGTSHAVDVTDDYVTTLAVAGQEPVGTRNLPSFYHSIHHARRYREHRALVDFSAAA